MQTVTLDVPLEDKLETPDQKLDEGESIVKRVVPLSGLYQELKGMTFMHLVVDPIINVFCSAIVEYERKEVSVFHFGCKGRPYMKELILTQYVLRTTWSMSVSCIWRPDWTLRTRFEMESYLDATGAAKCLLTCNNIAL